MTEPSKNERAIDILARTIWGEARGEQESGMIAVANVVLNRVAVAQKRGGHYWWGHDVQSVCLKPWQFSCWNKNDPNYKKLLQVTEENKFFLKAKRIARQAVCSVLKDLTKGATHYHTKTIHPYWAKEKKPVCEIGHHLFYKLEG